MFCPKCRAEYRAGIVRCAHCELPLTAELPPEDGFQSADGMAALLAGKELEAVMVGNHVGLTQAQRLLARHRVPTVIAGEAEGEVEAAVHARFFLMVAPEDLERARQVIEEHWKEGVEREGLMLAKGVGGGGDAEAGAGKCPACGAAVPDNASECPDCGLFLGQGEA